MSIARKKFDAYKLTYLSIMTAIVVVLQLAGSFIHLGQFSVTLVLVPIVLGVVVCGPLSGLWLGLVFGATVLFSGDASFFLGLNPFGTVVTVLMKGMLCGLCSGLVFRFLNKVNRYLAILVSAVVCPVVNTAVFVLGCYLFFLNDIKMYAADAGKSVFMFIVLFYIGGNFLFELLFNVILSPAISTLLNILRKSVRS